MSESRWKAYKWDSSLRAGIYGSLYNLIRTHQGRSFLFPGFMSLVCFLSRVLKPKIPILLQLEQFKIYLNPKDDSMTPMILTDRVHERLGTDILKKELKPGMTFIDIGANIGYYTLLAAQLVGPQGKVYAFEPEPVNRDYLIQNVKLNHLQNVEILPHAVSNFSGPLDLYLDNGNFGGHTCAQKNIQTACTDKLQVSAVMLDEFVEQKNIRADFLKMDIEGAEGMALEKAGKTIEKGLPKMLMEFWPAGLRNLGTDPGQLLDRLNKSFRIKIVGDGDTYQSPAEVLKKAEASRYLNLFLVKRTAEER